MFCVDLLGILESLKRSWSSLGWPFFMIKAGLSNIAHLLIKSCTFQKSYIVVDSFIIICFTYFKQKSYIFVDSFVTYFKQQ